jgi:hypothetical protein
MAKQYIDNLSEEVRKGFQEKAEQGRYPAGRVPFGYYIDNSVGMIVVDQEKAPLVQEMFTLYAENKVSLQMLAAWARRNSVVNRNGKRPITKSQTERILKHRFYLDEFEWCGKVFKGEHEAIISRQLFEATQQVFSNHNKPHYEDRQFAFRDALRAAAGSLSQWQSLIRPWQLEAENLRAILRSDSHESVARLPAANRILKLC